MTSGFFHSIPSEFITFCALMKNLLAISSPSNVTNINNTHCHSQHSLTHSTVLPTPIQLCYMQEVIALSTASQFT